MKVTIVHGFLAKSLSVMVLPWEEIGNKRRVYAVAGAQVRIQDGAEGAYLPAHLCARSAGRKFSISASLGIMMLVLSQPNFRWYTETGTVARVDHDLLELLVPDERLQLAQAVHLVERGVCQRFRARMVRAQVRADHAGYGRVAGEEILFHELRRFSPRWLPAASWR